MEQGPRLAKGSGSKFSHLPDGSGLARRFGGLAMFGGSLGGSFIVALMNHNPGRDFITSFFCSMGMFYVAFSILRPFLADKLPF